MNRFCKAQTVSSLSHHTWKTNFIVFWIFKPLRPSDPCVRQLARPSLIQIMAWVCLAKPLSEPMLIYYQIDHWEQISAKLISKHNAFIENIHSNMLFAKWRSFCPDLHVSTCNVLSPMSINHFFGRTCFLSLTQGNMSDQLLNTIAYIHVKQIWKKHRCFIKKHMTKFSFDEIDKSPAH